MNVDNQLIGGMPLLEVDVGAVVRRYTNSMRVTLRHSTGNTSDNHRTGEAIGYCVHSNGTWNKTLDVPW